MTYGSGITYELTLALKNAGFPQPRTDRIIEIPDVQGTGSIIYFNGESVYVPTPSELIKQCGDDFIRLEHNGSVWAAFGQLNRYGDKLSDTIQCGGKTPEEAVARLWLALNPSVPR